MEIDNSPETYPWNKLMGIQKVSSSDHPHGLCSVLFFGSCNMRCPTCHNKDIAWERTDEPPLDKSVVFTHLKRSVEMGYFNRVTVTGGEPLNVPDLEKALVEIKSLGYSIKLDTNGMRADFAIDLLQRRAVDLLAVDIKGPFEKYWELTGGTYGEDYARGEVEKLLEYASRNPSQVYFRTTLVPSLTVYDVGSVRRMIPRGVQWNTQNFIDPEQKR